MYRTSPSKIWRKQKSKYKLIGSKFKKSKKAYYPPRTVEPGTGDTNHSPIEFENFAKLITWSIIHAAPYGFTKMVPYGVGILEFKNGERVTGMIVDVDYQKLQKGDILYPTFRKFYSDGDSGIIQYGLKWTR